MTTIVERDSSNSALVAVLIFLLAVGLAAAYWGGAFTSRETRVIENNRIIEKEKVLPLPVPDKPSTQSEKPSTDQPAQ